MRTRPGFQVRGIRSSLRWSRGLEWIPNTWKPRSSPNWRPLNDFSESTSVLGKWTNVLVMSVSMNKIDCAKLHFTSKHLNYYFQSKDWKKQFKSPPQYFHGILSSLTWCHSARLIEWYTHELLMSLRKFYKKQMLYKAKKRCANVTEQIKIYLIYLPMYLCRSILSRRISVVFDKFM